MYDFYKFNINEAVNYFKESHFGTPDPSERDIRDLDGWQFLSTLYTIIHIIEQKAKKYQHICIYDQEGELDSLGKKPESTFDFDFAKNPDFKYAVNFSVNGYKVNWLEQYKGKSPVGTSIYGFYFGACPHSSALSIFFYFQ